MATQTQSPRDRVIAEYEAQQAATLAQLPDEVRAVLDAMANSEGRDTIVDGLANVLRTRERADSAEWRMMLLGSMNYACRVGHLTYGGLEIVNAYVATLRK